MTEEQSLINTLKTILREEKGLILLWSRSEDTSRLVAHNVSRQEIYGLFMKAMMDINNKSHDE
jgi:hypothetical protein